MLFYVCDHKSLITRLERILNLFELFSILISSLTKGIDFSKQGQKLKNSILFYLFLTDFSTLNLTSHGIMHYLRSADLPKSFSQLIVSILIFSRYFFTRFLSWLCQYLFFVITFLTRFCRAEKCAVTSHCRYRDSLTLMLLYYNLFDLI